MYPAALRELEHEDPTSKWAFLAPGPCLLTGFEPLTQLPVTDCCRGWSTLDAVSEQDTDLVSTTYVSITPESLPGTSPLLPLVTIVRVRKFRRHTRNPRGIGSLRSG